MAVNIQRLLANACRFLFVIGLFLLGACMATGQTSASSQELPLPAESDLSRNPTLAIDWANRVMANDPKVRASAEAALVQGAGRSLPLLRRFLNRRNEDLHLETFDIIRRIGPAAIPLLADMLRHDWASIRRSAVDVLIDLAPDTERIQPALRRALGDADSLVARDAARALGALGQRAGPSVSALVKALSHEEPHVRLYAAEALASIGPKAGAATKDLARAVSDPIPGVRWAACEALASIGPAAQPAVPQLIEALKDEFLYVRLCAAGALGSIGPKAQIAREALRVAADDPTLRIEAEWALNRIAGVESGEPVVSPPVPAAAIAPQPQTTVAQTGNPPVEWNTTTGHNIVWSVELGTETFGRPVVVGDAVYVGTDNARHMNPACQEECGVLMAFRATDGTFLWQDVAPRVNRGLREFLLPSTTSAPYVEGSRLYYVTAECQLRCLDTQGFRDGENNGRYREERFQDNAAADIVWELDLCARLGVFPHEASNSEVLPVGDLLMVCTSNGQNEGHTRVPSPRAPSLIAVDKHSGEVVWRAIGPGEQVLHGQWSSPVAANVNGRTQVLFGGGDGWLRAYDAASGRELWRFDGNPKDARWLPRPGVLSRSSIIASPVFADGRVFLAMGQDPLHGNGPSFVHAISPNGQGDVTGSMLLWTSREVGRVVGTPIANDGLLYVGDLGGTLHCLDAATGAHVWKHETNGAIWGCLLLAGDRLYVGNVEGGMTVLRAGRRKELLAHIEMDAPLYSRPALVGDALYLATAHRLYLIAAKGLNPLRVRAQNVGTAGSRTAHAARRLAEPGPNCGLKEGDLVVGIVRRPDPVPCPNCAVGEWDMCRNGQYTERGIKQIHGFMSERWRIEPEYAIKVDPTLGMLGVLLEPTTVVAKAWEHVLAVGRRAFWEPKTVLVTGAGPIGLLGALLGRQLGLEVHVLDRAETGSKPELVRALGATYHTCSVSKIGFEPDVILECTGVGQVIAESMFAIGASGVVCLAGVGHGGAVPKIATADVASSAVLKNNVVFGSVNANKRHWFKAAEALARADRSWLGRLITRRVRPENFAQALARNSDDIKVVIQFSEV